MCVPFSPRKRQHINKFDPHPFSGQSQEGCLCFLVFFSPDVRIGNVTPAREDFLETKKKVSLSDAMGLAFFLLVYCVPSLAGNNQGLEGRRKKKLNREVLQLPPTEPVLESKRLFCRFAYAQPDNYRAHA